MTVVGSQFSASKSARSRSRYGIARRTMANKSSSANSSQAEAATICCARMSSGAAGLWGRHSQLWLEKQAAKFADCILRDRDRIYGAVVTRRIRAMGIRDKPTAPASPWQNGFAERLIGSIRRECVDHFIVLGEAHLRRVLRAYARYYNDIRTHRSLNKDAPVSRPIQLTGSIKSHPILGGLHHHYVRV